MEKILGIIGNKKLISAFERNDLVALNQIATKLYKKARRVQDKNEYLLSACLSYSRNEATDIEVVLRAYLEKHCEEMALTARADIQCSAEFIEEQDVLRRYDMKITAYEKMYAACMCSGIVCQQ